MKKLINKKTGEIAYIDLYFNTITFSHSKTTHKISIQKDPDSHKITKITTSPEPIPNPNPIPKTISEPTPKPIINNNCFELTNNPTPNSNNSSSESNNIPTPKIKKSTSNPTNNKKSNIEHKSTNKAINANQNSSEFLDKYLIYEMYPETEIIESPDSLNSSLLTPTNKIPA